jgi:chromosome segregation ATPase
LSLDPDDPITDAGDKLATAAGEAIEADHALREAKQLFELKRREASELRESQDRIERELKRHKEAMARILEGKAAATKDDAIERALRRKLENVQSDLRSRNQEVATLRRDVSAKEIKSPRFAAAPKTTRRKPMRTQKRTRNNLFLPQDSGVHHPLRLIEFPRKTSSSG